MDHINYYQVLGVDKNATPEQIKQAYRKLAFQYHPDRNMNDPAASQKMMEINEAYATLSDPRKRQEYDMLGERYGSAAHDQFRQAHSQEDIFRGSDINQVFEEFAKSFGFRSSDEVLKDFYGPGYRSFEFRRPGVFARGFVFTGSGGRASDGEDKVSRLAPDQVAGLPLSGLSGKVIKRVLKMAGIEAPERGRDWNDTLKISVGQSQAGGEAEYHYRKWGNPKNLMVKIPPGMGDGRRIKLTGMGSPGKGGAEAGDLYLRVKIQRGFFQRIKSLFKRG